MFLIRHQCRSDSALSQRQHKQGFWHSEVWFLFWAWLQLLMSFFCAVAHPNVPIPTCNYKMHCFVRVCCKINPILLMAEDNSVIKWEDPMSSGLMLVHCRYSMKETTKGSRYQEYQTQYFSSSACKKSSNLKASVTKQKHWQAWGHLQSNLACATSIFIDTHYI